MSLEPFINSEPFTFGVELEILQHQGENIEAPTDLAAIP